MEAVYEVSSDSNDTVILPLSQERPHGTKSEEEYKGIEYGASSSSEKFKRLYDISSDEEGGDKWVSNVSEKYARIEENLLRKYSSTNSASSGVSNNLDVMSKLSDKYKLSGSDDDNYETPETFDFGLDADLPQYKETVSDDDDNDDDESSQEGTTNDISPQPSTSKTKKELQIEARNLKKLERERMREEKNREKAIKQALATANRNIQPDECMKFVKAFIDSDMANEHYASEIVSALRGVNVEYEIKSQIFPNMVTWSRRDQTHLLGDDGQLSLNTDTAETEEVLLVMSWKDLVQYVNNNTLPGHIQSLQAVLHNKRLSLVIFGLQAYLRHSKNQRNSEFRAEITGAESSQSKDHKLFQGAPKVSRKEIDFALTELQFLTSCSTCMAETKAELGQVVVQFTKAVANIPYKRQKRERHQNAAWYITGDNKDCVKVDKNGNGLQRLWNQILTTFSLARLETAEAISSIYPTPATLIEAYSRCATVQEGEWLLKDVPIRRAAGPLASVRKIGPELSKKIYYHFTTLDGDTLL